MRQNRRHLHFGVVALPGRFYQFSQIKYSPLKYCLSNGRFFNNKKILDSFIPNFSIEIRTPSSFC